MGPTTYFHEEKKENYYVETTFIWGYDVSEHVIKVVLQYKP